MIDPLEQKIAAQKEDLTAALGQLEEALMLAPTRIHKDATIQRFEFTFELSWKLMQSTAAAEGVPVFGPRQSIRTAAQLGRVSDPDAWLSLLKARNLTTHIYREALADRVYEDAKKLPALVVELLKTTSAEQKQTRDDPGITHTEQTQVCN